MYLYLVGTSCCMDCCICFHPIMLDRDCVLSRITLFSVPLSLTVGSRCWMLLITDQLGAGLLVPSSIVACFRVALVRKNIPEFSWLHCGRRHLVSHVTVQERTMACHFFLRPTMFINDGPSASMRSL